MDGSAFPLKKSIKKGDNATYCDKNNEYPVIQ